MVIEKENRKLDEIIELESEISLFLRSLQPKIVKYFSGDRTLFEGLGYFNFEGEIAQCIEYLDSLKEIDPNSEVFHNQKSKTLIGAIGIIDEELRISETLDLNGLGSQKLLDFDSLTHTNRCRITSTHPDSIIDYETHQGIPKYRPRK